jgi:hypothetical protein
LKPAADDFSRAVTTTERPVVNTQRLSSVVVPIIMGLRWPGTVAIIIVVFAALWETKDHNVPATKEEWQALLYYWVTPSDEVIEYLVTMRATLQDVVRSAGPFLVAVGQLIYLTAWPLVMGLYLLLSKAGLGFYEYVIVRFIASPTTIRHVRYGVSTAIAWQMARTKREVAMEVAGLASLISLYLLLRFLNRQRYLDRFKAYVRRQRRKLQMVRVDISSICTDRLCCCCRCCCGG